MLAIALVLSIQRDWVHTFTLLSQTSDLYRLTRDSGKLPSGGPVHEYKTIEASSFDRASTSAGAEGWFANADYGKYLRSEVNEGRTEWVMGDFEGPGAMVRFWSANPMGIVRLYFDGSSEPLVEAKMADLLQGKVKPWDERFSYNAARGTNLYFPFSFSKRLKVTVSESTPGERLNGLYYQLNTRLYAANTSVYSLEAKQIALLLKRDSIGVPPPMPANRPGRLQRFTVEAGRSHVVPFSASNQSAIDEVVIQLEKDDRKFAPSDPRSMESRTKLIEVVGTFDGQETVRVPLPDFFGAGVLPAKLETVATSVQDGLLRFKLPMPFQRTASLRLVNHGKHSFSGKIQTSVASNPDADYVLHAQWTADTARSRPMRDMNLVNFFGEGRYVGTVMHVQNPTQAWWGEGDEKVWVDGERFPSWIGTGTEDYFGYAWSNPEVFSRPYHGQARADGPGCGGQIGNVRWHVMDDIPFKKKIRFDIEQWHWEDVPSRFDMTAFWYAKPGTWTAPQLDLEGLKIIDGPKPPTPVKGAIEGEKLRITSTTGGKNEVQAFGGLSSGQQLWWKEAEDGEMIVLEFEANRSGLQSLSANLCFARDYGIQELFVNGRSIGMIDFYSPDLLWKIVDLGRVVLNKGKNELKIVCKGSNPKANPPSRMFGLDYLMIK